MVCTSEQSGGGAAGKMVRMSDPRLDETVTRPTACPFCHGKRIDTFAKTYTVNTMWRCRECDATWTIASRAAPSGRRPSRF